MKKSKIIVDTSIWIEYFKNESDIVDLIEDKLMENCIFITGPIVSELLQGVKSEKEYDKLKNSIEAIPFIEGTYKDWKKVGSISFDLRREGITIPMTDIFISVIAINNNASVYTQDKHFKEIPEVSLYGN